MPSSGVFDRMYPFPCFPPIMWGSAGDQGHSEVDPITFLITLQPGLDKQSLEKLHRSDVNSSLVCCQVAAQVNEHLSVLRHCSFTGSVYVCVFMYGGYWPVASLENRQQTALDETWWPNKHKRLTHSREQQVYVGENGEKLDFYYLVSQ